MAACAALAAGAFTGCDDDFDYPPVIVPEATIKANTSIAQLKAQYWDDARNYCVEIGETDNGEHTIISGRVIGNDATGNVYKALVIQDETAALTISINAKNLYENYKVGQEIVMDLTGMYIGKYNGLQQLGTPKEYNGDLEADRMEESEFTSHTQINGLPDTKAIEAYPITISELLNSKDAASLQRWQSQLIKLENVSFAQGGQATFSDAGTSTNRAVVDSEGNSINLYTSNYSTFAGEYLPEGSGSLTALAQYNGTNWRLIIRDLNDLEGFNWDFTPDIPDTPTEWPTGNGLFKKATSVTPGKFYVLVHAPNMVATPIEQSKSYGYLVGEAGSVATDGSLTTAMTNALYIDKSGEAFTLYDTYGRYVSMDDVESHKSFQLYTTLQGGSLWSITVDAQSQATITNVQRNATIGWADNFSNFAPQSSGVLPILYEWTGQQGGAVTPDTPVTPPDTETAATFTLAGDIISGKQYVWATAAGMVATPRPAGQSYGYFNVEQAEVNGETLKTSTANAFTITAQPDGSYTIVDSQGRFVGMDNDPAHKSFQLFTAAQEGAFWTIDVLANSGEATITNMLRNVWVGWTSEFQTFAPGSAGEKPRLYQRVD